ncbi:MAG: hypothetical protein FWC81_01870 [Coriobacteriia bacterium]|nr:hypothetical protein [Coriobacteriia bacterium]
MLTVIKIAAIRHVRSKEAFIIKTIHRHIEKLVFRIVLLAVALVLLATNSEALNYTQLLEPPLQVGITQAFLWLIWLSLTYGMLFRIIPNRRIAIGARKQFACSYEPAKADNLAPQAKRTLRKSMNKGALLSLLSWLTITSVALLALYLYGTLTPAVVLVIALAFGVLDLIFIIFFCPFQKLFMRNRCCAVCRIHNWDYLMMCLPLVLFPSFFSVTLAVLALTVIMRWELAFYRSPPFFSHQTNRNLRCTSCSDKLCQFKK